MSEDSSVVKVLPDYLVNQIAAGEVVESPASVVKELVENSIDAGACRITVEIAEGGIGLVRVIDDGCGMSKVDAVTAMQRHATSKISAVDDLMAIGTLGFRGEALPSIASVSRFSLTTRRAADDVGTRIDAQEGRMTTVPCAARVGTTIEVRDLFFNVPARLKFQKGEKSQTMAIAETFRRTALAHPGIHFVMRSGLRTIVDLPPCSGLYDRSVMVVGSDCRDSLFSFGLERDGISVRGVLGAPSVARGDYSRCVLLVNGRPVNDNGLRRSMLAAYSVLLPAGRFPIAVADIRVDPSEVDVNVHPAKHEVRFVRPRDVASVLYEAMSAVIETTPWIRSAPDGTVASTATGVAAGDVFGQAGGALRAPVNSWNANPAVAPGLFDEGAAKQDSLRYVGQVAGTVLVCEKDGAVVFIDQHAAHERINFNRLWQSLQNGEAASERLLFPEVVKLDSADMDRFEQVAGFMQRVGFDLEAYSGDSVAVRAIPAIVRGRSVEPLVHEAVHAATDQSAGSGDAVLRKIVATVACHASVRAGDRLSDVEAITLVRSMSDESLSSYCPHGRQAVVVTRVADMLKWFDR